MRLNKADRERIARLNEPAPVGGGAGVNAYLYELYRSRPDLQEAFPDLEGGDAERLVEWAHVRGRREVPIIDELMPPAPARLPEVAAPSPSSPDPPLGVNVIGHLDAELGIGEAARLAIAGLDAAGVPLLPVQGGLRPSTRRAHQYEVVDTAAAGFPLNILCTNPPEVGQLLEEVPESFFSERLSVGWWWWEVLENLPFEWRGHDGLLEEVWAASRHVVDAVEPFCSVPVRQVTLPVVVPPVSSLSRDALGLPEGFLFLVLFDYHSTLERKNPLGAIRAFEQAFAPGSGAALVVKSINGHTCPEKHAQLEAAGAEHPDVHVIDGFLSAARKNALIDACDCYVSLHRAEGFGLPAAEAQYLGKPVVATGFSGNLEFMTAENSLLVQHEPARVGPGANPYPEGALWAEPDLEHAAALMRGLFDDPAEAGRIGRRAAADIRRTHSPAVAGETMKRQLERLAPAAVQGPLHLRRARSLLDSGPVPPPRSPFGPLGRLARRALLRLTKPLSQHQRMVNEELLGGIGRLEVELAHHRARTMAEWRGPALVLPPPVPPEQPIRVPASNGAGLERSVELRRRVDAVAGWWHSIDLGHGVVTPGRKGGLEAMQRELLSLRLPALRGRMVLDIGTWDGFYAFEAERAGASRVVALDHFVWERESAGRSGFDLAREVLQSEVEPVVADFMAMELEELGRFDVVLFLGVLYHLEDPLRALRRLYSVTGDVAVIESEAIVVPGRDQLALCEFYSADQLAGDPTNWWAPTLPAIEQMCAAAGFARTETIVGPPPVLSSQPDPVHYRAVVHAWR